MAYAKTLMVQGTASNVGKSTLVAGLCRLFAQDGWRVAPFKAQNMALNSWVTRDGGEMGRAQVVQAQAAGIEPRVEMNPVLLKPEGATRSQVIVMGKPVATMEAQAYYRDRARIVPIVEQALASLRAEYDLVLIEGAGSPVELNLAQHDLVNMHIARLADAAVLLVGDIDRGGIFAALLGTLMLLEPADRARVRGLIVNKFRGDMALWHAGERMLADRAGLPVIGTVPYFQNIHIAEEDSVPLEQGNVLLATASTRVMNDENKVVVVIPRLPYLSNYDEFDALVADARVRVHFVGGDGEMPEVVDLIIVPGTKNTLFDLAWLWRTGLAMSIRQRVRAGSALLGICGGYQMLGERVCDPAGIEGRAGAVEPGLGLLAVETVFTALEDKVLRQCHVQISPGAKKGLFAALAADSLQAYQIHTGRTIALRDEGRWQEPVFLVDDGEPDGFMRDDGWVIGCYLHGLFENSRFRDKVVRVLVERRWGVGSADGSAQGVGLDREREYDKLVQVLRDSLDIAQLREICGLRCT
jgi:adenosylcobyric acid synthase